MSMVKKFICIFPVLFAIPTPSSIGDELESIMKLPIESCLYEAWRVPDDVGSFLFYLQNDEAGGKACPGVNSFQRNQAPNPTTVKCCTGGGGGGYDGSDDANDSPAGTLQAYKEFDDLLAEFAKCCTGGNGGGKTGDP